MISARKLSLRLVLPSFAAIAALTATFAPGIAQATGTPRPVPRWAAGGFLVHAPAAPALPSAPAAPAAAAPAAGLAPAVAWDGTAAFLFYTGSDGHAYAAPVSPPVTVSPLGGRFIGGPGAAFVPDPASPGIALFGRGLNNALYAFDGRGWFSLGGKLTSRPGAAAGVLGGSVTIDIAVRGTDSSVWVDHLTTSSAPAWRGLGGRTLAGAAPAAVNVGGTLYVLTVGTDGSVWDRSTTDGSHWTAWAALGGRVSGELGAATPSAGAGIVYARGGNKSLYYNEFAGTTTGVTPGWHSLGGVITSGAGAGAAGNGTDPTWAVALGGNGHIYANSGIWPHTSWAQIL